ncbi:MAG: tRNA (N(6)-L-threonylcarbamoyladenosine(37)-C(2))-methylthiotransferase MtaB [Bacteroidales bacterium]
MEENISKRVAFLTLGCKLNYSETSSLARQFVENGYEKVPSSKEADIYVINTCSVTEHADKKCRSAIRKLHKQNPDAIIAVTGCYAQLKPQEILDIEGVDLVLGADQKENLFIKVLQIMGEGKTGTHREGRAFSCAISEVETIFPAYSSDDRTRSFLKVQDGCDYHCSYCTIPLARGKSRNNPIPFIVNEAREIAAKGIKEVVLTGVNIGDFGRSTGESFADLLKELDNVEGIERYRISSIEPNLLTEEIIQWMSQSKKFLPHLHIPLQSGSDTVLARMKRRYNRELFRHKIETVRKYMPDVFIGVDVIVGFPGESEEEFMDCYHFLESVRPSFLHIFPYSKRINTLAAEIGDQVKDSDKTDREKRLKELSDRLHREFVEANKGKTEKVLFESTQKGGKMFGYTRNYIRVEQPYKREMIGRIVDITL